MSWPQFLSTGRLAEIVLAVMALQAFVLIARRPRRWLDIVAALAPGVFLTLALRAALDREGWMIVALWLALSGPAHVFDMRRRGLYARR